MSLKNEVIFILGIAKFDGPYESTSYTIAKMLAEDNDVYYIDYPYTWKDYASKKDEAFKTRAACFSKSSDGLIATKISRLKILIVPPVLSINFLPEGKFYRWLLRFNQQIIKKRVEACIKLKEIKDFIFINSFNFHYPDVGSMLRPKLLLYHCVDPLIVAHDRKHGIVSEEIIVRASNVVVCTSKQLYLEKLKQNPNCYFIPNAADIRHTSKALRDDLKIHNYLEDIPHPIVGYFGNIERRIDYNLLAQVIQLNPGISFVFAGPVEDGYVPDTFMLPKNVFFIGRIPYDDMPSVVKGFDVCIIPFKKDEVSHTIFPLKLFEYLGSGKPVVSTDFNTDLVEFTFDQVKYCADYEAFSNAIHDAIYSDTTEMRTERLKIAANNTWAKRFEEFSSIISQYLSSNG